MILSVIVIFAIIGAAYVIIGATAKNDGKDSISNIAAVDNSEEGRGATNGQPESQNDKDVPALGNQKDQTATKTNNDKTNTNKTIMNGQHLITIKTDLGDITFQTYDADAPKTVQNFITLAGKGFYDGVIFHRVIPGFMIQGGDPTGTGMGGPGYKFEDELNPATDSYKAGYKKGVVAMANAGPNTNGSQFFIMVADYPLPNNYTIFGKVVSGQDIADKISQQPRDQRNGDRPLTPIKMSQVIVSEK